MKSGLLAKLIVLSLSVLIIVFFRIMATTIYPKNLDISAIPSFLIHKLFGQESSSRDRMYVRSLRDPDQDKDGLEDSIAEAQIYKTSSKNFNSNGSKISDGEYIYNLYRKAFESDNEGLLAQYRINLKRYGVKSSPNSMVASIGGAFLNDSSNSETPETYDFYVNLPAEIQVIVKQATDFRLQGNYEKSLELLQNVLSKNPNSSIIKYHLGLTYGSLKNYEKALTIYEEIVNDPVVKSPLLYSGLASMSQALGKEDKFVEYLELSIRDFPEDLNQYLKLASYYQSKNELDRAIEILNKGLEIQPRYADYYNALGVIAGLKGDKKTELDLYKRAVTYDFRYAPGHFNLSVLYEQSYDDLNNGLTEARIAFEIDPSPRNLGQVILLYSKLGNKAKALELENQLLAMKNIDGGAFNSLGLVYLDQGNYQKAEIYLRKALEVEPRLANIYNNLGALLSSTNRSDEAYLAYQKAVEIDPNYTTALLNLGIYHTNKKQYKQAISSFQKATDLNPNLSKAYDHLGYIYWLLRDKELSRFYYKKAVELGSKDTSTIENLKILGE